MSKLKQIVSKSDFLSRIAKSSLCYYESMVGTRMARALHKEELKQKATVENALHTISQRWPNTGSDEKESPIFILSAGWRSGSTLLQRLIMSKDSILVWGEPYSHSGLLDGLAMPIKALTQNWPADHWFIDHYAPAELSNLWVANLYPDIKALQKANLCYMQTLFKHPAEELGFSRWGVKDVRLTIDHAHFLKWLYPHAKFLFLYRNPYKAYMSYRPARSWYKQWPSQPVFTPKAFAEHWLELLSGYIGGKEEIGGLLIQYEELCSDSFDVRPLQDYLGMDIDSSILKNKVGGSYIKSSDVPRYELRQVRRVVEPLASSIGYRYGEW